MALAKPIFLTTDDGAYILTSAGEALLLSTLGNINDIDITSIDVITAFDTDGSYLFTLDELQSATISNTQDSTEITGKRGRKLTTLKRNKSVTIEAESGLVSGGVLELQTGGMFSHNTATEILWTDYLTVNDNTATTDWSAIGTAGAEIERLTVKASTGVVAYDLTQDSVASAGKFAYDPSTKVLTFSGLADGTEIVVCYKRRITASVLNNSSDSFSGRCRLYIDATGEDKCFNIYHIQFYIPKADVSGEFSFEWGDNQAIHDFQAESLTGACGAGQRFWTYTVFGIETGDSI